jgi:hypothetical protein
MKERSVFVAFAAKALVTTVIVVRKQSSHMENLLVVPVIYFDMMISKQLRQELQFTPLKYEPDVFCVSTQFPQSLRTANQRWLKGKAGVFSCRFDDGWSVLSFAPTQLNRKTR